MRALPLRILLPVLAHAGCCGPTAVPVATPEQIDQGLEQLSWLVGSWGTSDGNCFSEEHWIALRGGTMLGVNRSTEGAVTKFFEFLRIESSRDAVTYWGAPLGSAPTPFRMTSVSPFRAVFENPEHDFPQRIIYERTGDELLARVEGVENGVARASEWKWSRLVDEKSFSVSAGSRDKAPR